MSKRNAYRISIERGDKLVYRELHRLLNTLFNGHVEETGDGFYAEDSPSVDGAFRNGDARYVPPSVLKQELTSQVYASWTEIVEAAEKRDDVEVQPPEDIGRYADIIESIVHEYADDTACVREENELRV